MRFSLKATPRRRLGAVAHHKTHDYPGLAEAIEAAIPEFGARPRSVIACGAGPVEDGRKLKLTNAPWRIVGPDVAKRLGLGQGLLLNDFEAQALSLPTIPEPGRAASARSASARRGRRSSSGPAPASASRR